jgi:phospholipase D-like protein
MTDAGLIGAWKLIILVPFFLFAVVGTIFWIWMLIDCVTKETNEGSNRLIWVLIIIFTHWIGALIYLIVRRRQRMAETGQ